jgi:hypothetical protein
MKIFEFVSLPLLIAALVAMVNVFTEVCKRLFNIENPQRVVVIWSVALSEGASFAAVILQGWLTAKAYTLAAGAGVLIGLLVAYAAMYGYDELYKDVLNIFEKLIGYITGGWKKADEDDQQPEP